MAANERGLGRGLDSLFHSSAGTTEKKSGTDTLTLTQIIPAAHQPRKFFDENQLKELATSIKNQGVVQPLIVRPKADSAPLVYEIVAGERRWRAAKLAGLTEVPVVIANYSDTEAMTVALVENLQREDLNPLEEAEALNKLKQAYDFSQEELAARLGKSRSAVANALRLLQLPEAMQRALAEGSISAGHGRALLAINDEGIRADLFEHAQALSVREMEAAVEYWKKHKNLPPALSKSGIIKKAAARVAKSERIKNIQNSLRQSVHHNVVVSGTEEKGKIALPFNSKEELEQLLKLLGVERTEEQA